MNTYEVQHRAVPTSARSPEAGSSHRRSSNTRSGSIIVLAESFEDTVAIAKAYFDKNGWTRDITYVNQIHAGVISRASVDAMTLPVTTSPDNEDDSNGPGYP